LPFLLLANRSAWIDAHPTFRWCLLLIGDRHRSDFGTITDVLADWSAPYSKTSERPEMLLGLLMDGLAQGVAESLALLGYY